MKRLAHIALLVAGKTRDSFLLRVPRLGERLGPVRSSSYRLASRISNILGAGEPVVDFGAFSPCELILVSMPQDGLLPLVDELLGHKFDWKTKTVLLCDSDSSIDALRKLAHAGAATGSLTPVAGFEERLFVAEGNRKAIREARLLVAGPGVKVIPMDSGRKDLYTAGVNLATCLALPLVAASAETLRASGIEQNEAVLIVERLFQRTLRAYMKGGRKAWEGHLVTQDHDAIRRQVQALFKISPQLAGFFYENVRHAAHMFRQDPVWLDGIGHELRPKAEKRAG